MRLISGCCAAVCLSAFVAPARPLFIGQSGCENKIAPAGSLAGARFCAEGGIDVLTIPLALTKDDVVIVSPSPVLDSFGLKGNVRAHSWDEVRSKCRLKPVGTMTNETFATFKETLAVAAKMKAVILDFSWLFDRKLIDRAVAEALTAGLAPNRIWLMTNIEAGLRHFKTAHPAHPRVGNYGINFSQGKWSMANDWSFKCADRNAVFTNMLAKAKELDLKALNLYSIASNEVALAHQSGFKVFANINSRQQAASFRAMGVDAMRTAYPHSYGDPDWVVKQNAADIRSIVRPLGGVQTASGKNTRISFPIDGRMRGIALMPSSTGTLATVSLQCADGTKNGWQMRAVGETVRLPVDACGKKRGEIIFLPDAKLEIPYGNSIYGRPDMNGFWCRGWSSKAGVELVERWDYLPGASKRWYYFDVAPSSRGGSDLYLNGEWLMRIATGPKAWNWRLDIGPINAKGFAAVTNMTVALPDGWKYKIIENDALPQDGRFVCCDFAKKPRARRFFGGRLTGVEEGYCDFGGVPIKVASPDEAGDVALARLNQGQHSLECDNWMSRSPLTSYPAEVRFRVPSADYVKAHILFALDPDSAKRKVLTVRIAHYLQKSGGSGGRMIVDQLVTCDAKSGLPEGAEKVGSVVKDGVVSGVYRLSVPIDMGMLADIADEMDYLDFEFLGQTISQLKNGAADSSHPDENISSAFTIFGATLEQAPFKVAFRQCSPGNVFTADEPAAARKTGFDLVCVVPCSGAVRWTARDDAGKRVFAGSAEYMLQKSGDKAHIEIGLDRAKDVGLYSLDIDFGGVLSHRAKFCVTPKSGRRTPAEKSPFGAGAFFAHSVPTDMKTLLPLYDKMGVKRLANWPWMKKRPDVPKKESGYISSGQVLIISPYRGGFDPKTGKFGIGEKAVVKDLQAKIEAMPYVDTVLVWHETAPNVSGAVGQWGPCAEILGWPVPAATEKDIAACRYLAECERIIRKHFPKLKMQIGNSGSSLGAATIPFRGGATGSCYDLFGTECPGQEIMPERSSGLNGIQWVREIVEKNAKRPISLGACHEFTSRTSRELGEPTQAAFYMRDALICLTSRMPFVNLGSIVEARNAYYNTFWGASGLCERGPTCYPKLSYLAYSVMTKMLDGATFVRLLDTGSSTIYAAEFSRDDGKYVTVLWCARGEAVCQTGWFVGDEAYSMRGKPLSARKTPFGQEPSYLVTKKPLDSFRIVKRTFAKGERFFDGGRNAVRLSTAAIDFSPTNAIVTSLEKCAPVFVKGAFSLSDVNDPEVGPCVELALDTSVTQYTSKVFCENVTIKLKEPRPLKPDATVIGMKVKGDSNWGQIYFHIEDGEGKSWQSYRHWLDAFMSDWPGNTCVNFDGWGYVYLTLRTNDLVFDTISDDWKKEWPGMKKPVPPFKLKAITISRYRHPYGLFGSLEPYKNPVLRLHSVFAY